MTDEAKKDAGSNEPDQERRAFLKIAVTASVVLAAGGVAAIAKSIANPALASGGASPPTTFPRFKVANISALRENTPISFYYPLDSEPNVLVKLGVPADGGVGQAGDIVAFSVICQHLGCLYGFQPSGTSPNCNSSFKSDRPVGYCCCHGSVYDFTHGAQVLAGPSPRPQPQVILELDASGDIYAVGMKPPAIFGHDTGSNDVTADLQGGNLVK
jgi:arsenite oxidase small subunit